MQQKDQVFKSVKTIDLESEDEPPTNEQHLKASLSTVESQLEISKRKAMKMIKLISDLKVCIGHTDWHDDFVEQVRRERGVS